MSRKTILMVSIVIGIISTVSFASYYTIASSEISSQTILDTDKTIIGQDISYPQGLAKITSKIVTIPVGAETGDHIHETPLFAYIMEGDLVIDYGQVGSKDFTKGDSFMEAINYTHNGINLGEKPVKILIVLMDD